jgi:osmotically-inducible protein OsmY
MTNLNRFKTLAVMLALTGSLAACDAISGRETAGAYVDDTTITTRVLAEIVNDPTLKASEVGVETMKNVVQLSGFVDTNQKALRAGELARNVPGVQSVRNNLIVK